MPTTTITPSTTPTTPTTSSAPTRAGAGIGPRLVLVGTGFLPVSLIATTAVLGSGLRLLATFLLVPALVVAALTVRRLPGSRAVVGHAIVAGLVATALYDGVRFAFLGTGLMVGDPIPHIGSALDLHPDWLFGYLWRYLLNGVGLAVAFTMLGLRGRRRGMAYGLAVCGGLLITLALSPHAQQTLFPLTPVTVVMATLGHLVYGAVLGKMSTGIVPVDNGAYCACCGWCSWWGGRDCRDRPSAAVRRRAPRLSVPHR